MVCLRPSGHDRWQRGFQGDARQAVGQVAACGGGQAHRGEQGSFRVGGDLVVAAVDVPPDRVDPGQFGEVVEFGVGDAGLSVMAG